MKGAEQALINQRLRSKTAWSLLSLDNSPLVLGMLQSHLFEKDKRLPHSVLLERLRKDLDTLCDKGVNMPQPAESYLSAWLSAGYLERSFQANSSEEEYSLSATATRAIQFIQTLQAKRTVATESRLSLVISQLGELAEQTETDPDIRVNHLLQERERIDAEINAVRGGKQPQLPEDRALERVREVIVLAQELAEDFRYVQDEFQGLNRSLREQIIENNSSRGEVLEKVFTGVDLISESDAGKTFRAFWRLLTDPEQSLEFESALDRVLSREFAWKLERRERLFLVQLTRLLLDNGGEVHEVFQRFARGLKQFVQSRAYHEQRRLNQLLAQTQRQAIALKESYRPTEEIGLYLNLTSARLRSLSQWVLYDPSIDRLEAGIEQAEEADISLESVGELLAQSEIDFRRLREQVTALLQTRSQVSISDVLGFFPAEQGLGSVVGLLALGVQEGVMSEQSDRVSWKGLDGKERSARIPRIYFINEENRASTGH